MGKKSVCSKKGLDARALGMKKKESKKAKIVICVFYSFALVVFLIFGAFSAERLSNADAIDADFEVVNIPDALAGLQASSSRRALQSDDTDDLMASLGELTQQIEQIGEALGGEVGEAFAEATIQQEQQRAAALQQSLMMAQIPGYQEFQGSQGIALKALTEDSINRRDFDWKLMNPGEPPYTYFHPRLKPDLHAYDSCAMPMFWPGTNYDQVEFAEIRLEIEEICADNPDQCGSFGTGWSLQWKLKVAVYWLTVINYIVLLLGVFFWLPRLIGTICNCCMCCFNGIVIILSFVIISLPSGRACNFNLAPVNYEGDGKWDTSRTYSDEYKIIIAITIISIGLCGIQCCTFIPFFKTPYKKEEGSSSSDSDKEKKKRKDAKKSGNVQTYDQPGHSMQ